MNFIEEFTFDGAEMNYHENEIKFTTDSALNRNFSVIRSGDFCEPTATNSNTDPT